MGATDGRSRLLLVIADTDSYLKWGASLASTRPPDWDARLVLVRNTAAPSAGQRAAALVETGFSPGDIREVDPAAVPRLVVQSGADAVLVSTRGRIAAVLMRQLNTLAVRPVLVSGIPGIAFPVARKALNNRAQGDLVIAHSKRERADYLRLVSVGGRDVRVGLSRLPFAIPGTITHGEDLVFAAQAIVPRSRDDRLRVARLLRDAALADPSRRVVVKVRALAGEKQTHDEADGYAALLAELGRSPANLVIVGGAMRDALGTAQGLVTVSSTAALEAVALGVPVIALDVFGVGKPLINKVFVGSGVFGDEAAVIGREFRHPDPAWLDENYFHPPDDDNWGSQLDELAALRDAGPLLRRPAPQRGGAVRRAWDRKRAFGTADQTVTGALALAAGTPLRLIALAYRRLRAGRKSVGVVSVAAAHAAPDDQGSL